VIADANGLNGTETLAAGTILSIPNKVVNIHNKSSTFRVYDPNQVLGDPTPSAPTPAPPKQKKKGGCGGLGRILLVAVAVAVTIFVTRNLQAAVKVAQGIGAIGTKIAMVAAAVAGGAAGSIVSQGLGVATGLQDKFSWKGVAMAAIGAGVGQGLGMVSGLSGTTFAAGAARGALGNAITQGIGVATGLQKRFDWTGVAVGGVVGGVVNSASGWLDSRGLSGPAFSVRGMANDALSGMAGAIAGAATRSVLTGTSFGDNILKTLPDVIGATIGNAAAGRILAGPAASARVKNGTDPIGDLIDEINMRSGPSYGGQPFGQLLPVDEPVTTLNVERAPVMTIPDNLVTMSGIQLGQLSGQAPRPGGPRQWQMDEIVVTAPRRAPRPIYDATVRMSATTLDGRNRGQLSVGFKDNEATGFATFEGPTDTVRLRMYERGGRTVADLTAPNGQFSPRFNWEEGGGINWNGYSVTIPTAKGVLDAAVAEAGRDPWAIALTTPVLAAEIAPHLAALGVWGLARAGALRQSSKVAVPQVTANRIAGNAFRDELATALRAEGRTVEIEVYKPTLFGKRYMDLEVRLDGKLLGGVETKVGGSPYTTAQRAKDAWLRLIQEYPVTVVRDK
jgi:hypothetical protein